MTRPIHVPHPVFAFVGQYVVLLQWIEAQLDQAILLGRSHDKRQAVQSELASLSNAQKVTLFADLVLGAGPFDAGSRIDGWYERVKIVVERLGKERHRRNSIVHSQYLFDFVEIGISPLRSDLIRSAGRALLDQEELTAERTHEILGQLGLLAFDVSQVLVQLRHIHRD